jgi:hypothetical protein
MKGGIIHSTHSVGGLILRKGRKQIIFSYSTEQTAISQKGNPCFLASARLPQSRSASRLRLLRQEVNCHAASNLADAAY